jgi:glycine/D-amino acid oxidase-like deaminating enzyme
MWAELSVLSQPKDIAIIGGGFAGLTLAVALLRRHHKVRVFTDVADSLAASKAAHGISTVKGILESDDVTFGQKLEGHRGFEPWLSSVEALANMQRPDNVWITGATEKFRDLDYFRKEFGRIYRRDFVGAKRVLLNDVGLDSFMCAFYPGDWWVDPAYVLTVLEMAQKKLGGQIISERIEAVRYEDQRFQLSSKRAGHHCEVLVLASGSGTSDLTVSIGADPQNLIAVAGHTFKAKVSKQKVNVASPILVKGTTGFATSNSVVHWGSTSEPSVELKLSATIASPDDTAVERIATELWATLVPGSVPPAAKETTVRWGVRVRTRNRKPLCGRLSIPSYPNAQLWLNTGYYKSGIILSWLFAEQLQSQISQA